MKMAFTAALVFLTGFSSLVAIGFYEDLTRADKGRTEQWLVSRNPPDGFMFVGCSCHNTQADAENPDKNWWGDNLPRGAKLTALPFLRTDCEAMSRRAVKWVVFVKLEESPQ